MTDPAEPAASPPLAPGERLAGPAAQRHALAAWLAAVRADPGPPPGTAGLTLITLAALLSGQHPDAGIDLDILSAGITIAARRCARLGLPALLPPGRTWVAVASAEPGAHGGFHYPGQGYRHWQMTALLTRHGPLHGPGRSDPALAALDLLRGYAHDSLHYGSYRTYRAHPAPAGYGIARTRYGVNFRRPDGRVYSRPDPPGSTVTRNLGTITEAATDREGTLITRHAARTAGIGEPAGPAALTWRDATGRLTPAGLTAPAGVPPAGVPPAGAGPAGHHARMTRYYHAVTAPYTALLAELSPADPAALHDLIITATITGSLTSLCRALNQQHGPAAFTRLFKTPAWTAPRPG
jgi:hypothetical protein